MEVRADAKAKASVNTRGELQLQHYVDALVNVSAELNPIRACILVVCTEVEAQELFPPVNEGVRMLSLIHI